MESNKKFRTDPRLKLVDQVRQDCVITIMHIVLSKHWIVRYIKVHGNRKHPKDMGKTEIYVFLSHLETDRNISAPTQRQDMNALVFLYKQIRCILKKCNEISGKGGHKDKRY